MKLLFNKNRASNRRNAFTLIELVCSLAILSIILSGIVMAYQRTSERVLLREMHRRAVEVAQRQMEQLLATRQEPDVGDRGGTDEIDPLFDWEMELERVSATEEAPKRDLSNTVIEVTVTVWSAQEEYEQGEAVKLVRRFAELKPIPGEPVAVPLTPEIIEDPEWLVKLRERLGREPTAEEVFDEFMRVEGIDMDVFGSEEDDNGEEDEGEEDGSDDEDDDLDELD